MDATNLAVLAELQEYAQLYFDAIKEHNTTDGVCELRPGNYSAKELADREKAACGAYSRPVGDIFDEEVSISVDTFRMRFPYREIFYILARWEAMCRPGKSLKSVFTVGDVEEKTAKVLLCEQTELGKYKAKGMKLQHLTGNWWAPRKLPKCNSVELVYELNGVMFLPGTQAWSNDISNRNSAVLERCAKLDDAKTTEALLNFIATQESAPKFGYFVEVSRRAGVNTANTPKSEQPAIPTETPQISTGTVETTSVSAEGEKETQKQDKQVKKIIMEKKITALFEVDVPKSAKTLAKFVSKDKLRPVLCGVMIDPAASAMVATDTKKLQAYNVECVGEWSRNTQCYITAKVMRAIAGKTATVTMYGDVGEIECNGEVYPCDNVGKYPEWQRVIPDTAKHGKITFDKAGLKEFRKFVKSHIKSKYISIDIEGGASVAIVKAWDYNEYGDDTEFAERVEIALAELSQHEIFMHYLPISLYDCTDGCNGVIWVSPNYPAVFEGNAKHTICVFLPA